MSEIASKEQLLAAHRMIQPDMVNVRLLNNPPKLLLHKRVNDDRLFNTATSEFDSPNINLGTYFACGWRPSRISERKEGRMHDLLYMDIDMEFSGDRACRIHIKGYIWPMNLSLCDRIHCPHVVKAKSSKRFSSYLGGDC